METESRQAEPAPAGPVPKEEFLDAVQRHICQVLGFDFGFIDLVSGHEIVNVITFSGEDEKSEEEARKSVKNLTDENKQPLLYCCK